MGWYVARRVAVMVPVFLGATLLIYGMVFLLPGDPVAALAGDRPLTPAVAAQLRSHYHLDDPFLVQYLRYLGGILHGDLGRAYSGLPVSAVLAHAFPVTIRLALIALAVEAVLGIGFGVIAGLRQGGIFDSAVLVTGLVIIAIPIFVLGFLAQFLFGVQLEIAPVTVGERASVGRLLLPGIVLGAMSFAYVVRLTRSAVAANAHADYVRTATAKGLSRPRVVTVHILRNSLIPVVTFLGADLGALMGGAIVTEGIFNIHGVGGVLYQAVTRQETPTVVSIVTVLVLIYLITNLLVDLLYAALDPRIPMAEHTGFWLDAWRGLRRRPKFVIAAALILLILVVAAFPSLFTAADPTYADPSQSMLAPSAAHWFGTDLQGHDIYSRTVYGARASVTVGLGATLAVFVVGGALGALAGFYGSWIDAVVSRVTDVFLGLPLLLAAIVLMQVMHHRTVWTVIAILALFGWPQVARIARGAVLEVRASDYVLAAKALGLNRFQILLRHALPNAVGPVIAVATVALGIFIVTEATLSYLGVGLPTSVVSWGGDINVAQTRLRSGSPILFYPAGALAITVLAFMMMGDALRDALDPASRAWRA